ncbi:unnamed protein product, partial [Didymodactylos carnosus]
VIIDIGIIDNEQLIDILYDNKIFPLLRVEQTNIKIYDYSQCYPQLILGKSYVLNYCAQYLRIYTILLPLYKEANKLKSLINYITNLDYPKNKLDVKIIVESDDLSMVHENILYTLPSYMHLIKVPFSLPRTKPKALNYAMQYCKGKYVVIYDAEDRPAFDQLLKAVIEFDRLPEEYVCLQAKLTFYNENENLLTKLFNIEYCIWFEYLLTGLSLMSLPVLLGGTSNHFKLDILQKVGFWDAYNVTEDADLGCSPANAAELRWQPTPPKPTFTLPSLLIIQD